MPFCQQICQQYWYTNIHSKIWNIQVFSCHCKQNDIKISNVKKKKKWYWKNWKMFCISRQPQLLVAWKWHSVPISKGCERLAHLKPMYLICNDWCVCTSDTIKLLQPHRFLWFCKGYFKGKSFAVWCNIWSINSALRSKRREGHFNITSRWRTKSFVFIDCLSRNCTMVHNDHLFFKNPCPHK